MTRDLKATPAAIARLIEEFGSLTHLAIAIDVSPEELQAWLYGGRDVPEAKYIEMLEAVVALRANRQAE
jgi:hypothetical protein